MLFRSTVDGKKVNHKKPIELRYGVHTLGVYAEGYDAWTRQLVVNSAKANIEILLSSDTGTQSESDSHANADDENANAEDNDNTNEKNNTSGQAATGKRSKAGTKAGSKAGSYTSDNSSSQTSGDNSVNSALANAALGSSLASIITGGESTDYLDTLSDLVDSLDRLKRSSD